MQCFKEIQSTDINERYEEWMQRVHRNFFQFEDFNGEDATISYNTATILGDLNFRRQFYDELNDHFDWVRGELESHGLSVLKSEPIY